MPAGTATHNYRKGNPGMEDLSGRSAFFKGETGQISRTYSIHGRREEGFLGIYRYLEVSPMGRNETGPCHSLADGARLKPYYGQGARAAANDRSLLAEIGAQPICSGNASNGHASVRAPAYLARR